MADQKGDLAKEEDKQQQGEVCVPIAPPDRPAPDRMRVSFSAAPSPQFVSQLVAVRRCPSCARHSTWSLIMPLYTGKRNGVWMGWMLTVGSLFSGIGGIELG